MLYDILCRIRETSPIVHSIMNYVTINDCANLLLAVGASPVMGDAPQEAAEITSQSHALVINLGMLRPSAEESILASAACAKERGIPIILDPVGVGFSRYRRTLARRILAEYPVSVVRANRSEMRALFADEVTQRGVDTAHEELLTGDALTREMHYLSEKSSHHGIVLVATGSSDIVTCPAWHACVHNGVPEMRLVSGSGCQLTAFIGACVGASPDDAAKAALSATIAMGIAGEIARMRCTEHDGNMRFRDRMIDAIYHMNSNTFKEMASYELRAQKITSLCSDSGQS
jgi:hydroxyethylthiazole kinase